MAGITSRGLRSCRSARLARRSIRLYSPRSSGRCGLGRRGVTRRALFLRRFALALALLLPRPAAVCRSSSAQRLSLAHVLVPHAHQALRVCLAILRHARSAAADCTRTQRRRSGRTDSSGLTYPGGNVPFAGYTGSGSPGCCRFCARTWRCGARATAISAGPAAAASAARRERALDSTCCASVCSVSNST